MAADAKPKFKVEVFGCDSCPFANGEWLRCDCPVGSRLQSQLEYDGDTGGLRSAAGGPPCPLTKFALEVRRG